MKKVIALALGIFACLALSAGEPAAKGKPQAVKYIYVAPTTPGGIVPAAIEKGLRIAFLFDPAQAEWMKVVVPALKGTKPLVMVRGDLKPEETAALKKILDQFDYDAALLHIKLTAGDSLGVVPVTDLLTVERVVNLEQGWVDYDLRRGGDKPDRALQQSKQDAQDFVGNPFAVAGGMIFKRLNFCIVNFDRPGASLPKGATAVIFTADEAKLKKIAP